MENEKALTGINALQTTEFWIKNKLAGFFERFRLPSEEKKGMISAMEIRQSEEKDCPAILGIYDQARHFMVEQGNPHQWTNGAPDQASLAKDLALRRSYVVVEGSRIIGTFALTDHDSNYDEISGGWLNDDPYIAVHRLASIKPGVGTFILQSVCERYPNVRIDTHHDNTPMKNLLRKLGFVYCGSIILRDKDNSSREAYMKVSSL